MTYFKTVTLECDCEGCPGCDPDTEVGCLNYYDHDRGSATEAREHAAKGGWVYRRGGEDFCPDCAGYR